MAPKLKSNDDISQPGVIASHAVRYNGDETLKAPRPTVGVVKVSNESGYTKPGGALGKSTGAMGVEEFMEKGIGGAQLPRKRQERKEKEKTKRQRGQSTHASWKTEAEMVMRQQYD